MDLCLYQPEIPQNLGTLLRLGACMGVGIRVIEPCGFVISDKKLRRSGMDYMDHVDLTLVESWEAFLEQYKSRRIIALDTKGSVVYTDFTFQKDDILLLGQEGNGLPDSVLAQTTHQVRIPMMPGMRSLNVAVSAAMVLGEALRQTNRAYA
ncbi:MAG: tRNA (cytidine(34)-2'-O)-methyltransferase [Alphaproteobacteria bacterium]